MAIRSTAFAFVLVLVLTGCGATRVDVRATTSAVDGMVATARSVPLDGRPGIHVEVLEPATPTVVRTTTTGRDGAFILAALPAGTYDLRFSHVDYAPVLIANVAVTPRSTTNLGVIDLAPRDGPQAAP